MSMKENLTGKIFNDWTVLYENGRYKDKCILWYCRCKCGYERNLRTFHLTKNYSRSCRKCAHISTSLKLRSCFDINKVNEQFWNRYVLTGAHKRNLVVTITLDQANQIFKNQNGKCALTGIKLQFPAYRKDNNGTASLDRIDSSKGYTIDNVQWVHKHINIMKSDFEQQEFINFCKLIATNN